MQTALYHPEFGYYRRLRDPFGREGDFFTAEQVQPVFGILIARGGAQALRGDGRAGGLHGSGAGRGPGGDGAGIRGVAVRRGGCGARKISRNISMALCFPTNSSTRCRWRRRSSADGAYPRTVAWRAPAIASCGLRRRGAGRTRLTTFAATSRRRRRDGSTKRTSRRSPGWSASRASLDRGRVLTIDYGYTRREWVRFPRGTVMGYRRHTAREDVLESPGERDITAHVNFSALEERGTKCGLAFEGLQTLAQTLLAAGEADQFAAALGWRERERRNNCGGGCNSRRCCLEWGRRSGHCCRRSSRPKEKGPENSGPWSGTCLFAPREGRPKLLLFLRSSLLLRGGLLGCALHRLILPNIKFCDSKIAM